MTYDEAISFWYGRINYEVRSAHPADLKLERMRALLRRLGDPHERLRLVHVTGTKGKGSTCAMVASVLRAAGYRVGLFTSPHLMHVEERIRVNGVPISHAELAARVSEVAPAVLAMEAEAGPPPTFFEICTTLGFLHFVRRRCDIAVIEVGLGGRFDSTNVCRPLVSVITNIGLDHTAQLGHTLEAIAYQKAGIIKRCIPVVSGVTQEGAGAVIRRIAAEEHAPLWEVERPASSLPSCLGARLAFPSPVEVMSGRRPERRLNLPGAHQVVNAAVAQAVIARLRDAGLRISDAAVSRGLDEVTLPARIECVKECPTVILDTAHNVPSAEALIETLRNCFAVPGRRRVVFAVSADKPAADILRLLTGSFDHFHLTRYANNSRGVAPERLAAMLEEVAPGKAFSIHSSSLDAWNAACAASGPDDLICITGSFFLAGELRPTLIAESA